MSDEAEEAPRPSTLYLNERDRVHKEIAAELETTVNGMKLLNANLEHFIEVGQDFEKISSVWGSLIAACGERNL